MINNLVNFFLPVESKRRRIGQFIYRLITNKDNKNMLKKHIKQEGIKNGIRYAFYKLVVPGSREYNNDKYKEWISNNRLSNDQIEEQKNKIYHYNPLITVVTVLYNTQEKFFKEYLKSIMEQTYQNWEICLVDSSDSDLEYLKKYIKEEKRIKYKRLKRNNGISENTNVALEMARGEYIAFIDHDDVIENNAFYSVIEEVNKDKTIDFLYTDEDKFEEDLNNRYDPFFKPDFSIDFLRSTNYISHLSIVKKTLLDEIGNFRKEYDGAQDYDMIFRIVEKAKNIKHIPNILYHWRCHSLSTANNINKKEYAIDSGKRAIEEHLRREGYKNYSVINEKPLGLYRVKYSLTKNPLVSIIIPNKDSIKLLKKAIKTVLKNNYNNYEILVVENNSIKKRTFNYYKKINKIEKIKVLYYKENGYNYSKINNWAVKQSKGDYILLLNNDIKSIDNNWLVEMLSICQRDEVGAVGAKLLYNDKTVQHAGVIIGMGGVAGHVNRLISEKNPGYFGRAKVINNFSAVTAACLLTKREIYDKVNGLDEKLKVAFNDVDFCMKIIKLGKIIVFNPYAKLYHFESKTRGYEDTPEKIKRFNSEIDLFKTKWKNELLEGDKFFNKNLDLNSEQCEIKVK